MEHLTKYLCTRSDGLFLSNKSRMYQTFFIDNPNASFIFDKNYNLTMYNQALLDLIGIENSEISYKKLIVSDFLDLTDSGLKKALAGEKQIFNTVLVTKLKKRINVEMTLLPIKNNNIFDVIAIIQDLTELNQLKRKSQKNEDNLYHAQILGNTGSWDYDVIEDEAFWSKQMYVIFGINDTINYVPTYDNFFKFVHPGDQNYLHGVIKESMDVGSSIDVEFRIVRRDGQERIIRQIANAIVDECGKVVRLIGTIHDITENRKMERKLEESQAQVLNVYNNLEAGIWSFNPITKKFLFFSKGMEKISGYSYEMFEKKNNLWHSIIHPEDYQEFQRQQKSMINGEKTHSMYRIIHSDGDIRWVMNRSIPVVDADQNPIRIDGVITDITEQKKAEEKIKYIATHDQLTNLSNRVAFDKSLKKLLHKCKNNNEQLAILYLNIDLFKQINDTLGHAIGDELIKQISSRLLKVSIQERLFRMGGDEFSLILPGVSNDDTPIKVAKAITRALEPIFMVKGYELHITTSIGISISPISGDDEQTLLKSATTALSRAKQLGRNTIQIHNKLMNVEAYKRFELERDMRKALINNEFEVYFQPRVCSQTMQLVSAEALIRWIHPNWGLVNPGEFIPLAEETGFIHEIGDFVLYQVCRKLKEWQLQNIEVKPISVNVSAKSFLKNDLVSKIRTIISNEGINADLIELEITESSFLHNMDQVMAIISELKQLGVKVALDDFGTGFSSLTHLRNLNIDTIKIDRSFIQNITELQQDETITSCIIQLGQGLNMTVVAEGVETVEQLTLLQQKGCNQIQGFLFSKPVPANEFKFLLKKQKLSPQI